MSHYKPDPNKSVNLTIDGMPVTVPEGTRILDAALTVGVRIPTLCEHPGLCKRAVCRVCVVECDGRGKLFAACANDVAEGMRVVTNNLRILNIRKTIIELILANHPQDCLNCVRSKNCELQTLAATFGIRESPFRHEAVVAKKPVAENNALVRDMGKCVKCGRCVEACQKIQTVGAITNSHRGIHYQVSAPYGQALADGPCVFCGQCAAVCPVGAIYGHEQLAEVWAAIRNKDRRAVAQISPIVSVLAALGKELGLPLGTVSGGKIITALKRLGFDAVYDAGHSAKAAFAEEMRELVKRVPPCVSPCEEHGGTQGGTQGGKLPLVAGCSPGWNKFAENCYPDLAEHIFPYRPVQPQYAEDTVTVFIEPCIAKKLQPPNQPAVIHVTVKEIALMIKLAGIIFGALPESAFDEPPPCETAKDEFSGFTNCRELQRGIIEAETVIAGEKIKTLTVNGFANARTVMDSIRAGKCGAGLVKVLSCPAADGDQFGGCVLGSLYKLRT